MRMYEPGTSKLYPLYAFIPGYLEQQTLAMTSQKLLGTYFNIKSDTSNEGIDGQTATSQPTN